MHDLHPTRIDIPAEQRARLIAGSNQRLAEVFDLYSQAKQAHWNVKGSDFIQPHELFDELAASLLEHVDMIAERVTALGGDAAGTVRTAAAVSTLPEFPTGGIVGMDAVAALADRYASFGASVRVAIDEAEKLGDADTADLFTEVSRSTDKHLWFLEAHLQG